MASKKDKLEARKSSDRGGKGKSLSKSSVQKVMSAAQSARDKGVKDASFSDLAKLEKQTQVKYDRGADLDKYINKLDLYNKGIMAGATPDLETGRLNFVNRGVKDDQGRTILSMNQPYITAMPPTGKQLMGDIGRSLFSGYNTLSYDPNAVGTPSTTGGTISRVPGLVPNLINKAMEGKVGIIGGVRGLWDKVRGFFNPSQTPQGIETQFPRVSPEDRGYFGGYNQGIVTQIPVANDRGMVIPSYTTPQIQPNEMSNQQFQQEYPFLYNQSGIGGYLPEGFTGVGLPSIIPFENQYLVDASQSDIDRINKMRQLRGMDPQSIYDMRDVFQLSPELTLEDIQGIKEGTITQPTGIFAKNGGSIDKYAGLGYKFK